MRLRSVSVRATCHAISRVAVLHATSQGMLHGSMANRFQAGIKSSEGVVQSNGRKIPWITKFRRDMAMADCVYLILSVRCNPMLTKAPITVPIATPTAPILCTRYRLTQILTNASAMAAMVAKCCFPVAMTARE